MAQAKPEEKKKEKTRTFSPKDIAVMLGGNEPLSSIGKMIVSNKTSAPSYGFGTSDRDKETRRFLSKELSMGIHYGMTPSLSS